MTVPSAGTAGRSPDRPVTVSIHRRIHPDLVPDATRWVQAGVNMANTYPGFLGSGWVRAAKDSHDWHMLYRFADESTLDAWDSSPERVAWLQEGQGLVEEQRVERRTGIEGWFDAPARVEEPQISAERAPARWKQSVSIWLGFFPVNLAFTLLMSWAVPSFGELPVLPRVLVTTLVLTPIMTYAVLPWVTRRLAPWLAR
ncbi:antibiotic biosynthesis monooxygenase [Oerskovia enterophila]|jgi:antibiotic biosynthesis monooxygenase (ABM) superfamily enzyme|uniref:antibiotic biosynthesis monooxygenase n=1 Tax=Oerskovia enterophila TaxID=43678 RepID=UPI003399502E